MKKVSVIIINYNTKELTKSCVDSIVADRSNSDAEIIIIDNGSSDGSVKVLRDLWREHKNILLIENPVNYGFAKAVNMGIGKAMGEHVLLLNSDTKVTKEAIRKLVDFADKTPDCALVGARLINADGSIQPSCFNFPFIINAFKEYILGIEGSYGKFYPKGNKPVSVDMCVMAAVLITSRALKLVGYLDERYFMYMEDFDYCKRAYENNLKVYYLPKSEVLHAHGASGKSFKKQYTILKASSRIYHGWIKYYLINSIIWLGQKIR